MKNTEKKKFRPFWVVSCVQWILIGTLVFMAATRGKGDKETEMRLAESQRNAQALEREHEKGQDLEIRSHEERLKVLETAVVDLLTASPNQSASAVVQPAVRQDESASDEDFRAMVLKNAKQKE